MKTATAIVLTIIVSLSTSAQTSTSKVWVADNANGTYKNPILHADYSDPDVIRVGDDFYLVSSSFDAVPGLPILHSRDLVNWTIIAHALRRQPPYDVFARVQHGNGAWAPAIRYRDNEFYIYYPDPDRGIYLTKAKSIRGPWSEPALVEAGAGLIDPCPLWDDDGSAYLVHAYAGTRATIKSILVVKRMNAEGTKVISDPVLVFDGHDDHPTVEGPKFHKRNGYYYIFAPAGGVTAGWQLALRSKSVFGPYEHKVVLHQGTTTINGPHQGAWVTTQRGEDWFVHFQDKGAYGRIVHLQPMAWKNNWPVMGTDDNGDGNGEPVLTFKKPNVGRTYPIATPQESDEFNSPHLGLQWQWQANPDQRWAMTSGRLGYLRMNAVRMPDSAKNLWDVPALLLQKFPAEKFTATAKVSFKPRFEKDKFGLIVMGMSYAYVAITKKADALYLTHSTCIDANKGRAEVEQTNVKLTESTLYFRISVAEGAACTFSYSVDGSTFTTLPGTFTAVAGQWIGAKVGMFCSSSTLTNDSGYANVDWFRIE
ncbi:MAG: glycoside hydrolase 43 family protein [Ignavibacteriae bacterium]|nr:glycoside hydrolase 43 family protein [Ignavibacteriota bacterium]